MRENSSLKNNSESGIVAAGYIEGEGILKLRAEIFFKKE
jgi:hypothetical protein